MKKIGKPIVSREQKIQAAKNYLSIIRSNQARIWQYRFQRQEIKIEYSGVSGIDYAADRVQNSPTNAMEEAGWKLLEKLDKIDKQLLQLTTDRFERIDQIQKIPDVRLSTALQLYYASEMSMKRVGEYMNYSERQIIRIIQDAHETFYDLFLS